MNAGFAAAVFPRPPAANQCQQNIALPDRCFQALNKVRSRLYAKYIHEYPIVRKMLDQTVVNGVGEARGVVPSVAYENLLLSHVLRSSNVRQKD